MNLLRIFEFEINRKFVISFSFFAPVVLSNCTYAIPRSFSRFVVLVDLTIDTNLVYIVKV